MLLKWTFNLSRIRFNWSIPSDNLKTNNMQMKSKAGILVIILIYLGIAVSCHRSKESFVGNQYVAATKDFYVKKDSFVANTTTADFGTANVYFNADFSNDVTWFITIKGLSSGAVRKVTGLSYNLNAQNAIWNGGHDDLNFFQVGEYAVAELTFLGSSIVLRDTIFIQHAKRYNDQGVVLGNNGVSGDLDGFEGTFRFHNNLQWTYGSYSDGPVPPAYELDNFNSGKESIDSLVPQFQGKIAATLAGTDNNHSYFVGGLKRVLTLAEYNSIPHDPDSVYVNIFLYGKNDPHSYINYSFEESDNDSTVHVDSKDDTYTYQFSLNHSGWKLFYVKYSQLSRATDPNYGGSGNGIPEPHKLRNVDFNLISSPAGNTVGVTFDYPIITFGHPFNPNE